MNETSTNSPAAGVARPLPASAQRVQAALAAAGLASRVIELTDAARRCRAAPCW
jgi:hypothetical protein